MHKILIRLSFAILNYMDSLISAVIIPLVGSGMVLGGLLSISILQLPTIRRNMRREAVEQIYARIMEARMRLENTETFTNMAKESSIFADRFAVVDTPQEYYTVMSFIDLIEFLYGLKKTNMIDLLLEHRIRTLDQPSIGLLVFLHPIYQILSWLLQLFSFCMDLLIWYLFHFLQVYRVFLSTCYLLILLLLYIFHNEKHFG